METEASWGEKDLSELRATVEKRLSSKRFIHTAAVEKMVVRLCGLYAPEKATEMRAAALLHDLTKELTLQEQIALCHRVGIPVNPGDELSPKVFHAKTGSALIPLEFPQFATPTVVSAVRWHTTGHEGMTLTEKLLYLSDYIDESRTFPDCVRLREFFFGGNPESLNREGRLRHLRETLLLSYDMTIRGLLEEQSIISIDTMYAYNELIREKQADQAD